MQGCVTNAFAVWLYALRAYWLLLLPQTLPLYTAVTRLLLFF